MRISNYILLPLGVLIAYMSLSLCLKKKTHIGNWHLELITVNGETIFDRNDLSVSIRYNYTLNQPKTKEDSLNVEEFSTTKFEQSKKLKVIFESDSTFLTSRIRSGGRIDPNTMEGGTYHASNDSLYLTVTERNNYQLLLNYDRKKDVVYNESTVGETTTYIQYCRGE